MLTLFLALQTKTLGSIGSGTSPTVRRYVPLGHMVVQPLRTHDPQGSFLSHLSFNLRYLGQILQDNDAATYLLHSAQEISPRARFTSTSSSSLLCFLVAFLASEVRSAGMPEK